MVKLVSKHRKPIRKPKPRKMMLGLSTFMLLPSSRISALRNTLPASSANGVTMSSAASSSGIRPRRRWSEGPGLPWFSWLGANWTSTFPERLMPTSWARARRAVSKEKKSCLGRTRPVVPVSKMATVGLASRMSTPSTKSARTFAE